MNRSPSDSEASLVSLHVATQPEADGPPLDECGIVVSKMYSVYAQWNLHYCLDRYVGTSRMRIEADSPVVVKRNECAATDVIGVTSCSASTGDRLQGPHYSCYCALHISTFSMYTSTARLFLNKPLLGRSPLVARRGINYRAFQRFQPTFARLGTGFRYLTSYGSPNLTAGVAGGTVVLLGGYAWYHLSGAKKAVDSYNTAVHYYEQAKHAFVENAPKDPSEALNRLRNFAQSYLIVIPGARPHVDAAFDTIDELRDEHGNEVDRIVGGGYEEVRIVIRDAEAMDLATAVRVLNVLRRRSGELEELGRRAGSGVFESLARKYPQVSETLGVGYEEFKRLAQTKGPETKKVLSYQIQDIFRKGFSQESINQARNVIQSKTNEVRRIAQDSSQKAWDRSIEEAAPYLNKLPEIRQILSDNASNFVSAGASGVTNITSGTQELFSHIKDATRRDILKDERKMKELRDYVVQKAHEAEEQRNRQFERGWRSLQDWIRSMPGGDEALQRLPDMQVFVVVSRDRRDEAEELTKETYEEILRVLEEKGKKAKQLAEDAKAQ